MAREGAMKTCGMIANRVGVFTIALVAIIALFDVAPMLGFFGAGMSLVFFADYVDDRRRP
jgi:hypothetical protein